MEPGEVVGLMGDNGAGKSTMVKLIAGNFPPSEGEVAVDGEICHFHKPVEARAKGIEVVYQDLALGRQSDRRAECLSRPRNQEGGLALQRSRQAGDDRPRRRTVPANSSRKPGRAIWCKKMSGGQRQAVAIARTRLSNAKIVLMDEPTAAISVRQVAEVLELIRRLKAQGVAVMLISHRMPDVFAVSDRIIVLQARRKGCRQGNPQDLAGRNNRADHGSDPCSVAPPRPPPKPAMPRSPTSSRSRNRLRCSGSSPARPSGSRSRSSSSSSACRP